MSVDYFKLALDEMQRVHDKKRFDYSSELDAFSNFRFAAEFSNVPPEFTFEVLLGVKQARLINLMSGEGKTPLNESILDTLLDRANYAALAYAYALSREADEMLVESVEK